jgi:type I restriction enzyme S subunit
MIDGYKDSPLGNIPENWEIVTVKEITAEHKQGFYTKEGYTKEGIRLARITDLNNPKIDYSKMPLLKISDSDYQSYKINKGDFLFARSGAIGTYGIVETDEHEAIFASYLIRFKFNYNVVNRFFGYFFESYLCGNQLRGITQGNANVNINADNIKSLKFPLAPFEEQQKIAQILSTVDAKIEVIDQQITQTQELKKGLMQRLLTKGIGHTEFKDSPLGKIPKSWEVVKQSEVATFFNGRAYKLTEWEKEGIPVIRLQNLTGTGKTYYYSNLKLPDHQYCHNGDLLYMWSATFGPVKWFGDKAIYHYHIWKIEHDLNRLDSGFHYYLLDGVTARMKNESHGSTMLHVTKGGMEKLLIKLPSLKEQQKIADILSSVDEKLEVLLEKKVNYQELKQGLMQQLLTGKIRVKA